MKCSGCNWKCQLIFLIWIQSPFQTQWATPRLSLSWMRWLEILQMCVDAAAKSTQLLIGLTFGLVVVNNNKYTWAVSECVSTLIHLDCQKMIYGLGLPAVKYVANFTESSTLAQHPYSSLCGGSTVWWGMKADKRVLFWSLFLEWESFSLHSLIR